MTADLSDAICHVCFRGRPAPGPWHDKDCDYYCKKAPASAPPSASAAAPPRPSRLDRFLRSLFLELVLVLIMAWVGFEWSRRAPELVNQPQRLLFFTGFSISIVGLCYKLLPWDLIPDWIPIIGKLDDKIAMMVSILGVVVSGLAFYMADELS